MNGWFLAILVVLAGPATVRLASGDPVASPVKQRADFDGLAKYLAENRGNGLAGGVRRAAELFVELASARDCNDYVLLVAREATKSGLMESIAKSDYRGPLRSLVPGLNRLLNACVSYIDSQIERRVSSADVDMKKFLTSVSPWYGEWSEESNARNPILHVSDAERAPRMPLQVDDTSGTPYYDFMQPVSYAELQNYLRRLAKLMAPNDKYESSEDVERVFQRHLVEPCRRFEADFGPLFEGSKAMEAIMGNHRIMVLQNTQSISLAYTHNACEGVLLLAEDDNAGQRKLGFTRADVAQAHSSWPLPN